jgi:hypothetical protein
MRVAFHFGLIATEAILHLGKELGDIDGRGNHIRHGSS